MDGSNPATLFLGTTWEKQEGRFLLGSSQDFPLGSTGGSATTTLIEANMPKHRHKVDSTTATIPEHTHLLVTGRNDTTSYHGGSTSNGFEHIGNRVTYKDAASSGWVQSAGGGSTGAIAPYTNYIGSGTSFNNMPPYLAVNIWKRLS